MEDEKNCKEVHLEKENVGIANRKNHQTNDAEEKIPIK